MSTNPADWSLVPQSADQALGRRHAIDPSDLPAIVFAARSAPDEAFFPGPKGEEHLREAISASVAAAIRT